MRLRTGIFILGVFWALPSVAQANRVGGGDIVVPVPDAVWGAGGARGQQNNNCPRCCVYENRNYSQGAVLKIEGVLLQCVRDKQTLGTNNLIWQVIK